MKEEKKKHFWSQLIQKNLRFCLSSGCIKSESFAEMENEHPYNLQSNLNSSNTEGSFTTANSNSFLSPYEILPLAQGKQIFRKFSYFIMKLYVVCTH